MAAQEYWRKTRAVFNAGAGRANIRRGIARADHRRHQQAACGLRVALRRAPTGGALNLRANMGGKSSSNQTATAGHLPARVLTDESRTEGCDIVMMLRIQMNAWKASLFLPREYLFGLDREKLGYAKPDALVMHPGPMNRVEIDSAVVDDPERSHSRPSGNGRRRAHGSAGSASRQSAQWDGRRAMNIAFPMHV